MKAAEKKRRLGVREQATAEGFWSGRGSECAILCASCGMKMLILARKEEIAAGRPVLCSTCGFKRFAAKTAPSVEALIHGSDAAAERARMSAEAQALFERMFPTK